MRRLRWLLTALVFVALGCEGSVTGGPLRPSPPGEDIERLPPGVVLPAAQSRWPRLSHEEWRNTVRDLLGVDAMELSASFRPDAVPGNAVFDNPGGDFEVDGTLWTAYQQAAQTLARRAMQETAVRARVVPAGVSEDETGARAVITSFGRRVHRRPLTPAEVEEYLALYRLAPQVSEGGTGFDNGIQLVVEAMLQSPHFLYRGEDSTTLEDDLVVVGDFEMASRLSYAIWRSMPDDELLEAAAREELRTEEQVYAQALRLLADPRADRVIETFHHQLFDIEKLDGISPSRDAYPQVTDGLAAAARQELEAFLRHVLHDERGGLKELLTSTDTFVNAELASIYGLGGSFPEDRLVPATLDGSQRRGVFTQVGFLASRATSVQPDPIHRGVFLAERMACIHIGAPPDDVPALPPTMGRTNRQTIEDHTEREGTVCADCHSTLINPFGFPFESYDAVGAWRDLDNGFPVDTAAAPPIDGDPVDVAGAVELAQVLADSEAVHACYVEHWMQFLLGRTEADEDRTLSRDLAPRSQAGTLGVRELIAEVVSSKAFMRRAPDVPPEPEE
ncbi:MAG: DUF1592 domain-containing protein [Sandaracinaceae bacterium]